MAKYRLLHGKHTTYVNGKRVTLVPGDIFEPEDHELAAIKDKVQKIDTGGKVTNKEVQKSEPTILDDEQLFDILDNLNVGQVLKAVENGSYDKDQVIRLELEKETPRTSLLKGLGYEFPDEEEDNDE